jgi:AcrR family transcriptional regulator
MNQLKKGERAKQQLLEQAANLFNRNGIAGTTINDILAASGIHRSSLYSHFENKENLVYACTDYLIEQLTHHVMVAMIREKSAIGKIFAFLELNRDPLDPLIPGGCPTLNLSLSADDLSPSVNKKLKKALLNFMGVFKEILSNGVLSGELSADLPIESYVLKITCAIQGAIPYCNIMQSNRPMHDLISSFRTELLAYNLSYE